MSAASNSKNADGRRKRPAHDEVEQSLKIFDSCSSELCSAAGLSDAGVGRILGNMGYPKAGRAAFWINLCKRGASLQCRRSWTHGEYRKGSHQRAISAMLPEFLLEPTRKIGTSAWPIAPPHRSLIVWLFVGKRCALTLWDTAYLSRISLNGGPIFGAHASFALLLDHPYH